MHFLDRDHKSKVYERRAINVEGSRQGENFETKEKLLQSLTMVNSLIIGSKEGHQVCLTLASFSSGAWLCHSLVFSE